MRQLTAVLVLKNIRRIDWQRVKIQNFFICRLLVDCCAVYAHPAQQGSFDFAMDDFQLEAKLQGNSAEFEHTFIAEDGKQYKFTVTKETLAQVNDVLAHNPQLQTTEAHRLPGETSANIAVGTEGMRILPNAPPTENHATENHVQSVQTSEVMTDEAALNHFLSPEAAPDFQVDTLLTDSDVYPLVIYSDEIATTQHSTSQHSADNFHADSVMASMGLKQIGDRTQPGARAEEAADLFPATTLSVTNSDADMVMESLGLAEKNFVPVKADGTVPASTVKSKRTILQTDMLPAEITEANTSSMDSDRAKMVMITLGLIGPNDSNPASLRDAYNAAVRIEATPTGRRNANVQQLSPLRETRMARSSAMSDYAEAVETAGRAPAANPELSKTHIETTALLEDKEGAIASQYTSTAKPMTMDEARQIISRHQSGVEVRDASDPQLQAARERVGGLGENEKLLVVTPDISFSAVTNMIDRLSPVADRKELIELASNSQLRPTTRILAVRRLHGDEAAMVFEAKLNTGADVSETVKSGAKKGIDYDVRSNGMLVIYESVRGPAGETHLIFSENHGFLRVRETALLVSDNLGSIRANKDLIKSNLFEATIEDLKGNVLGREVVIRGGTEAQMLSTADALHVDANQKGIMAQIFRRSGGQAEFRFQSADEQSYQLTDISTRKQGGVERRNTNSRLCEQLAAKLLFWKMVKPALEKRGGSLIFSNKGSMREPITPQWRINWWQSYTRQIAKVLPRRRLEDNLRREDLNDYLRSNDDTITPETKLDVTQNLRKNAGDEVELFRGIEVDTALTACHACISKVPMNSKEFIEAVRSVSDSVRLPAMPAQRRAFAADRIVAAMKADPSFSLAAIHKFGREIADLETKTSDGVDRAMLDELAKSAFNADSTAPIRIDNTLVGESEVTWRGADQFYHRSVVNAALARSDSASTKILQTIGVLRSPARQLRWAVRQVL